VKLLDVLIPTEPMQRRAFAFSSRRFGRVIMSFDALSSAISEKRSIGGNKAFIAVFSSGGLIGENK
jgi:hypothetical protein